MGWISPRHEKLPGTPGTDSGFLVLRILRMRIACDSAARPGAQTRGPISHFSPKEACPHCGVHNADAHGHARLNKQHASSLIAGWSQAFPCPPCSSQKAASPPHACGSVRNPRSSARQKSGVRLPLQSARSLATCDDEGAREHASRTTHGPLRFLGGHE